MQTYGIAILLAIEKEGVNKTANDVQRRIQQGDFSDFMVCVEISACIYVSASCHRRDSFSVMRRTSYLGLHLN
jgi:hypothetical protein